MPSTAPRFVILSGGGREQVLGYQTSAVGAESYETEESKDLRTDFLFAVNEVHPNLFSLSRTNITGNRLLRPGSDSFPKGEALHCTKP